jgi:transposase InsO family protein
MCPEYGIDHRLTKTNHPWTNGHVKRMNRTLKDTPMEDLSRPNLSLPQRLRRSGEIK